MEHGMSSATYATFGHSTNKDLSLTGLAKELQALETGTFEIHDFAETGEEMVLGCSSGDLCSCACACLCLCLGG